MQMVGKQCETRRARTWHVGIGFEVRVEVQELMRFEQSAKDILKLQSLELRVHV